MNYNKGGLIILLLCVLLSFAYFVYIVFFSPPIQLAELKGDGEVVSPVSPEDLADEGDSEGGPSGEQEVATDTPSGGNQPLWMSSPAMVKKGLKVYQTYCASCHGAGGKGDGPAAMALKPPPRDLVKGGWKQGGSSMDLYKTLAKGIEGTSMVSFSYLSKEDRWALVHYVRSITQDKPKDDLKKLEEFAKTAP